MPDAKDKDKDSGSERDGAVGAASSSSYGSAVDLMAAALSSPLLPQQQQRLVALLRADPSLLRKGPLSPRQVGS